MHCRKVQTWRWLEVRVLINREIVGETERIQRGSRCWAPCSLRCFAQLFRPFPLRQEVRKSPAGGDSHVFIYVFTPGPLYWIYCFESALLFYTFKESKTRNVMNVIKKRHFRGRLNAALADPVRAEETDTERSVITSRGNVSGNSFVPVTHEKQGTQNNVDTWPKF